MPKWGLTERMLETRPWELSREWLEPAKVVADPVHGDIYLNRLEVAIVDSPSMQRLRRVRQLGTTSLVYPAATHTRFSHSLGALRSVQDLLDAVWDQQLRPKAARGQLDAWREAGELEEHFARATVLARLGGLLHDLCHLPFGHSVEDDLQLLIAHDENEDRFRILWEQVPEEIRETISGELFGELKPLILSKTDESTQRKKAYPWVEDIVGNTICADLIDYLQRDHLYTGLPIALGHRFLESFYVTPDGGGTKQQRMALMLHRDGHERIDVATELLKFLRYRYELSERALVHHAKLAADAMVGRLLEEYWGQVLASFTQQAWLDAGEPVADPAMGAGLDAQADAWASQDESRCLDLAARTRAAVEERLLLHGDEGLLEYLKGASAASSEPSAVPINELASRLLDRRLFKLVGRCSPRDVAPKDLYDEFGEAPRRRRLEREAATWAGIQDDWKLIIWLPPPGMRLKPAGVLVSDGSSVRRFVDYERPSGERGSEIYKAHENLWSVCVYVAPELRDDPRVERALVWLAYEMDVRWEQLNARYSETPKSWPDELFARELKANFDASVVDEVLAQPVALRAGQQDSFEGRLARYRTQARRVSTRTA